jgi:peroxiredoxin
MSEEPGSRPSDPEPPPLGLDPDRAIADERAPRPTPPRRPAPVIDTRRYQWMIGAIGVAVILAIGAYLFATRGTSTTGVTAGHRLRWFAAPLASSDLQGAANLHPPCTLAGHDPRALNLCLDARRGPVVLSLFVLDGSCERQVSALQTLARRFAGRGVQFAAVALNASHAATAAAVRAHHWTIPVAYDVDGRVGEQYGVVACPMVELARRGGIVTDRLIGNRWADATALEPRVRALIGDGG